MNFYYIHPESLTDSVVLSRHLILLKHDSCGLSYIKKYCPPLNSLYYTRDNLIFKMSDDDWDTVMGVHLKGAFVCSRAAQKIMVENGYGRIVNLSSTSAVRPSANAAFKVPRAPGCHACHSVCIVRRSCDRVEKALSAVL